MDSLPPALRHENPQAIDIGDDQYRELVDMMNFLGEDPAVHTREQEIDEAITDPVPQYTPFPGKGEKTVEVSPSDKHPADPSPPPYRRERNKLSKRRPNNGQ